jgi:hypothetical protein
VYVASRSAATGVAIDRVPVSGGAAPVSVTTFAGAVAPAGLAVDAGTVFFLADGVTGGSLLAAPASGGTADILWSGADGTPTELVIADGRAWITIAADPDRGGRVLAIPTSGASALVAVDHVAHAAHIARDDANVYFTSDGALFRVPLSATATTEPARIASGLGVTAGLAVGDAVYVAAGYGVVRVPK